MAGVADITVADFKAHFYRDFTYGAVVAVGEVVDADITKAYDEAKVNFNEGLWASQEQIKIAFLYLAAHYLVSDIQASQQGLDSVSTFPVSSRSVGSVSESYQVPEWVSKSAYLSQFANTRYGLKFCSLIRPRLVAGIAVYAGATTQ
jgi:hypothetical protein